MTSQQSKTNEIGKQSISKETSELYIRRRVKKNTVFLPSLTPKVQVYGSGLILLLMALLWYIQDDTISIVVKNYEPMIKFNNIGRRFFNLSYEVANVSYSGEYGKGIDDAYFVTMAFFSYTICRIFILSAFHWMTRFTKINKERSRQRFAEQGYLVIYYIISFTWGIKIWKSLPTYGFHYEHYWIGYPHLFMTKDVKTYYLLQMAFWFNQFVALLTEKRRKDFWEMLSHHFITTGLVVGSYILNYHRIGNTILILFDAADILLSSAKMLLYMDHRQAADILFGIFVLIWIITRHILFAKTILSVIFDAPRYLEVAWDWDRGYFFNPVLHITFSILLLALQALIYFWFYLIAKVTYKTIIGKHADDNRSDTESEYVEEEIKVEPALNVNSKKQQ